MRDWGIEQKWMSILLPLLLLYNGTGFFINFFLKKEKERKCSVLALNLQAAVYKASEN